MPPKRAVAPQQQQQQQQQQRDQISASSTTVPPIPNHNTPSSSSTDSSRSHKPSVSAHRGYALVAGMAVLVVVGGLQVVYCVVVGNFVGLPFSFLALPSVYLFICLSIYIYPSLFVLSTGWDGMGWRSSSSSSEKGRVG